VAECLFCRISRKEIPAKVLYEDRLVMAFADINPQAPVHAIIIPKAHFETLNDVSAEEEQLLGHVVIAATKLAGDLGLRDHGYRLVANCLASAGQSVFHVHFHLLGGRTFAWPPG
jgi:histidine triad (HIT) family protein